MRVKVHELVSSVRLRRDPAEYATAAGLVGNHDAWVRAEIGAWRWPLLHKHRATIKPLLIDRYALDLGGAAAPVGYGAIVVDYQNRATDGGDYIAPRSLFDVPPEPDTIFCSHTLEHFVDARHALAAIQLKLKVGGHFVCLVPNWTKTNLQAAVWPYHEQTFCLQADRAAPESFTRLDTLCSEVGLCVELRECADNNILVIAQKPGHWT